MGEQGSSDPQFCAVDLQEGQWACQLQKPPRPCLLSLEWYCGCCFVFIWGLCCCFEMGVHYVAQAGPDLTVPLKLQSAWVTGCNTIGQNFLLSHGFSAHSQCSVFGRAHCLLTYPPYFCTFLNSWASLSHGSMNPALHLLSILFFPFSPFCIVLLSFSLLAFLPSLSPHLPQSLLVFHSAKDRTQGLV